MRESKFIDQNKEKWAEFEKMIKHKSKDPEKLSKLFIQITDDLSYSRTFYRNRSVRVYLNNLAQKVFKNLYANKKFSAERFKSFWTNDLPQVMYDARKELLVSFLLFALSMAVGVLSCHNDPNFVQSILGDAYVEMTEGNIAAGDPLAVYKDSPPVPMFLRIGLNNLMVAFRTFVMGLFLAVGSLFIMIYNGVMVGTFQYYFFEKDLFLESFLTIWVHGALEISAIIIAGCAGLTLGRGLVFPGTLTRLQSFQLSAKRGLMIMLGITPIIILAAFIESFLTRYTEAPDLLRGAIIAASFTFMIFYFAVYPFLKARRGFDTTSLQQRLPATPNERLDFGRIKSLGELFRDSFLFLSKHFGSLLGLSFVLSLLYALVLYNTFDFSEIANLESSEMAFFNVFEYLDYRESPILIFFNTLALSIVFFWMGYLLKNQAKGISAGEKWNKTYLLPHFRDKFIPTLLISAILNALFLMPMGAAFLLIIPLWPLGLLWMMIAHLDDDGFGASLGKTFNLIKGQVGDLIGLSIIMMLMIVPIILVLDSSIFYFYFEFIAMFIDLPRGDIIHLSTAFKTYSTIQGLLLGLPLLFIGTGFFYYSLKEINSATQLLARIKRLGEKGKYSQKPQS